MATKPNTTLQTLLKQVPLRETENFVGAFVGRTGIKWGWYLLIGPLAAFSMKQYQVAVTDQRVVFGRLSVLGSLTIINNFTYDRIQVVTLKKGLLTCKIRFAFKNGRQLVLVANHKAVKSMDGFLFNEELGSYLLKAVA